MCILPQEDAIYFRNVGIDYICPNPKNHLHFSKVRVEREVAVGAMRFMGKHKRVAYFVDLHRLEVVAGKGYAATVQRVRGAGLLHIKKAR